MNDSWVTVATFSTLVEAELARNRLAAEGIESHLSDGEVVTMIQLFGAMAGVKLLVAGEHAGRATTLLQRIQRGRHVRRDDYGLEQSITDVPERVSVAAEEAPAAQAGDDDAEDDIEESPKDMVARRAFRAAVYGLFFCPGLLHIISAFALLEVSEARGELSTVGRNCVLGALAIDAAVFLVPLAVLISAFAR